MIKYYWRLMIILGIQHQVFSHSANVQQKISALGKKLNTDIQDLQLKYNSEELESFIDNYDLIFSDPAAETSDKPILRVGHRHRHVGHRHRHAGHRHRVPKHRLRKTDIRDPPQLPTGADSNETTTTNEPETLTTIEDSPLTSTTPIIPTNEVFDANVKLLQEKVEAAIKNLTDYISQSEPNMAEEHVATISPIQRRTNAKVSKVIPFYRRFNYLNDAERKKPQKWVHCLDLIAPRLQGMKDDGLKEVNRHHGEVKELAQLLYTDVSKFNSQDMVSILTQISKIRIRMYQWTQNAITILLNVITRGPEYQHSFKTLKVGLKRLFDNWHLDTSMLPVFLKQTRIFRPPCIDISGPSGSTKRPGGDRVYTKPDKPKKKTHNPDISCQSRENHKYNNDHP